MTSLSAESSLRANFSFHRHLLRPHGATLLTFAVFLMTLFNFDEVFSAGTVRPSPTAKQACANMAHNHTKALRTSHDPFKDVASKTITASIVLEARATVKTLNVTKTAGTTEIGGRVDADGCYIDLTLKVRHIYKGRVNNVGVGAVSTASVVTIGICDAGKSVTEDSCVNIRSRTFNVSSVFEAHSTNLLLFLDGVSVKNPTKKGGRVTYFRLNGDPSPATRRNVNEVIEYSAPKHARLPKAKLKPENATLTLQSKKPLVLECRATGRPTPFINWFKDETQLLATDKTLKIQTISRGSKLLINKAQTSDSGVYRCLAINVAGNSSSENISITVSTGMKTTWKPISSHFGSCPPSEDPVCYNGGTCFIFLNAPHTHNCICPDGFEASDKCRTKKIPDTLLPVVYASTREKIITTLSIVGIACGVVGVLSLFVIVCVVSKKGCRANESKNHEARKETGARAGLGAPGRRSNENHLKVENPNRAHNKNNSSVTHQNTAEWLAGSTTSDNDLTLHLSNDNHFNGKRSNIYENPSESKLLRNKPGRLPQHSTTDAEIEPISVAITSASSPNRTHSTASRNRLSGTSATPDLEECRRADDGGRGGSGSVAAHDDDDDCIDTSSTLLKHIPITVAAERLRNQHDVFPRDLSPVDECASPESPNSARAGHSNKTSATTVRPNNDVNNNNNNSGRPGVNPLGRTQNRMQAAESVPRPRELTLGSLPPNQNASADGVNMSKVDKTKALRKTGNLARDSLYDSDPDATVV